MQFSEQTKAFFRLYLKDNIDPIVFLRSDAGWVYTNKSGNEAKTTEMNVHVSSIIASGTVKADEVHVTDKKSEMLKKELKYIEDMDNYNAFFTPNDFNWNRSVATNIMRQQPFVYGMDFVYADIDFKDCQELVEAYTDKQERKQHIDEMKDKYIPVILDMLGKDLPEPTLVVMSGHGIHIYWKIKRLKAGIAEDGIPLTSQDASNWYWVQDYIYNKLKWYGADPRVAHNYVGVIRMPGSFNKKPDMDPVETKILKFNPDICYDIRKDFIDPFKILVRSRPGSIPKEDRPKKARKVIKKKKVVITTTEPEKCEIGPFDNVNHNAALIPDNDPAIIIHIRYNKNNLNRRHDLIKLAKNRDTGSRELIIFCYRYVMLQMTRDPELALQECFALNREFEEPLSDYEVEVVTGSVNKWFESDSMFMTNWGMANFLSVSHEEVKEFGLSVLVPDETRKERRTAACKKYDDKNRRSTKKQDEKQQRYEYIYIHSQSFCGTMKQTELATELNMSLSTIERAMKYIREHVKDFEKRTGIICKSA